MSRRQDSCHRLPDRKSEFRLQVASRGRRGLAGHPASLRICEDAARIVLPGVGHFASTECLLTSGIGDALRERVAGGIPFLGICVGLQWLFAGSTEAPGDTGLGVFPAALRALSCRRSSLRMLAGIRSN